MTGRTFRPLNNSLPGLREIPLYSDLVLINQVNSVNQSNHFTFRSPLYYKHRPDVPGSSIGKVSSTNAES